MPSDMRSLDTSWEMNRQPGTSSQVSPSSKVASTATSASESSIHPRTPPRSG